METLKTEENKEKKLVKDLFWKNTLLFTILGLIVISVAGYFVFNNSWIVIITNHIGGLGIIGLLAYLTAFIANRKNYNYWKVLSISIMLPVIIGIIEVIIISLKTDFIYCGGGVCLLISVILFLFYLIRKKKK